MATLSVPASLEQLGAVNEFIAGQLPEGLAALLPQVELAAEELLVNVFSYAYPGEPGKAEVGCRMVHLDGVPFFCLAVRDWGAPFDPFSEAPEPDTALGVEDRPIGGLGVYLIKSMVGHYSYSYHDASNCIELYFALPE